jgi:molecular chaperone GrpE
MAAKKQKTEIKRKITNEEKSVSSPEVQTNSEPEFMEAAVSAEEELIQRGHERDQALVKANEYLEGWQRERAEFFNYKKRMERELSQGGQNAFGNAIRRYLDIADDLGRALKSTNRPTEGSGSIWAEGIDLIHRKLVSAFEADGVKMIEIEGKSFDPNLHEAISSEDSPDHESGQIIEVVQPGYILGERVIRPARVRVAR